MYTCTPFVFCIKNIFLCLLENVLYSGDHVPWNMPLDGSESRIQHMLMAEDAQLLPISTPFGSVNFVQVSLMNFWFYQELNDIGKLKL